MIVTFGLIHILGGERSHTNPGHGYPASTETTTSYRAFEDKDEWEDAIRECLAPRFGMPCEFYAAEVVPAVITTSVNVILVDNDSAILVTPTTEIDVVC